MGFCMSAMDEVRAVVFDAHGTLFDLASAAERESDGLGEGWRELAELWRKKQLEYTWLRSLQGYHADFWQVTGDALDFAMASLGLRDAALRERLMVLYLHLGAYADAKETLERLRRAGRRTAILSNGTPRMLREAAAHAGLSPHLDLVLSVEEVGVYKPHPSVYRLAAIHLGLRPAEMLFVSANGWDAFSAKASGFRVAWCNRAGQEPERIPATPDAKVRALGEVPALLGI
jgi:2-haloacid dehalogenase